MKVIKHRQHSMDNATSGEISLSTRQGQFFTLTVLMKTLSGFLLALFFVMPAAEVDNDGL